MSHAMLIVLAALGGELLLVLLGLLTLSWWRNRAARRRDDQAIRALVERIKKAKGEREAVLARFLAERMGMSGEALAQGRADLLRAELQLLQRLAIMYKRRDALAAAELDRDLYAALDSYHALPTAHGGATAQAARGELDDLRAQNQHLAEELRTAMENMSRMVNDFSSMLPAATSPVETSPENTLGADPVDDQAVAGPHEVEAHAAASGEVGLDPPASEQPPDGAEDTRADTVPAVDAGAASRVAPAQVTHEATRHLEEGPVEVVGFDEDDSLDAADDDGVFEAPESSAAAAGPRAADGDRQAKGPAERA